MFRHALLVSAFLLFLNVSLVLCREDYQQYYSNHFSHHHRKSTPGDAVSTEAPVSSDEGVSASGGPVFAAVKTTGDITDKQHGSDDHVVQRYDYDYITYDDYQTAAQVRIVSIVLSLVGFIFGLIIIFCCGKKMGRKVQTGRIVNPAGALPPQPGFHFSPTVELQKVP